MKKVTTIGELRKSISRYNDDDIVVIETTDLVTGDAIDLYPFYIDEINGLRVSSGKEINEIRLCQLNNINK